MGRDAECADAGGGVGIGGCGCGRGCVGWRVRVRKVHVGSVGHGLYGRRYFPSVISYA